MTPPAPFDLHELSPTRVPLALADLHAQLPVGVEVALHLPAERRRWDADLAVAVVVGAGFTVEGAPGAVPRHRPPALVVRARRARTLADTVGPSMRLLVVGLNPSCYAADAGVGFARPGNRFWPAAVAAGVVSRPRDPRHALEAHGVGMTDLVKRATPAAAALDPAEHVAGLGRLDALCRWLRPEHVVVAGLTGWRAAVDRRASAGWHPRGVGGRPVYVMPNPSGLNASARLDDLADHLRAAVRGPAAEALPRTAPPA